MWLIITCDCCRVNTFAVVGFQWSLGNNLPALYLATIEDDSDVKPALGKKQKQVEGAVNYD